MFFSFSAYLILVWIVRMPKQCFFIFWIFLQFSSPGWVGTEFGNKFFFSLSQPIVFPIWIEIMPKWCFLIFIIFLLFFIFEFFLLFFMAILARVESKWNSWLNFFFLFLGLSHPGLDRNNVGMMFFSFLNFFGIFLLGSGRNGIQY